MPRTFQSYKKRQFTIENKPMHSGGEGSIHPVISSGESLVAKIYHHTTKKEEAHRKILFMVNNPPFNNAPRHIQEAIIWPLDLLYDNGRFAGYVMPRVDSGVNLFPLILPGMPHLMNQSQWQKFSTTNPDALLVRMKLGYNLARAIHLLHQSGKYVLVDMKPENVLIKPNGYFSLIDIDSIQISNNRQLIFAASAMTGEYAPPEHFAGKYNNPRAVIPVSWDHFSFAVIFYQVLINIHPFMASHDKYSTVAENIEHGLFVHGRKKSRLMVIPAIHKRYKLLPVKLRNMFERALDHGSLNPSFRPSLEEWAAALLKEIKAFKPGSTRNTRFVTQPAGPQTRQQQTGPKIINSNPNRKQPGSNQNTGNNRHTGSRKQAGNQRKTAPAFSPARSVSTAEKLKKILKVNFRHLRSGAKAAAVVLIVALSGIALFNIDRIYNTITVSTRLSPENEVQVAINLTGQYYGFIMNENRQQAAYMQIRRSPADSSRFAVQIKFNIYDESLIGELTVNPQSNLVHLHSLGEGILKLKDGKTKIKSTENNKMSWYFEK